MSDAPILLVDDHGLIAEALVTRLRAALRRSLRACRRHERSGRCRVVEDLGARARRPPKS